MNTALSRRIAALEAGTRPPDNLNLVVQFVSPGCGVVAALLVGTGESFERHDGETEAAFLARTAVAADAAVFAHLKASEHH